MVIGGGNAAVSSAIAAEELADHVLILERSPQHIRGGNTVTPATPASGCVLLIHPAS